MYEIDKNVPVPTGKAFGPPRRYPFHEMKVGDSFVVDAENAQSAMTAACQHGRRHNAKMTTRKQPDGSRRIWRIA